MPAALRFKLLLSYVILASPVTASSVSQVPIVVNEYYGTKLCPKYANFELRFPTPCRGNESAFVCEPNAGKLNCRKIADKSKANKDVLTFECEHLVDLQIIAKAVNESPFCENVSLFIETAESMYLKKWKWGDDTKYKENHKMLVIKAFVGLARTANESKGLRYLDKTTHAGKTMISTAFTRNIQINWKEMEALKLQPAQKDMLWNVYRAELDNSWKTIGESLDDMLFQGLQEIFLSVKNHNPQNNQEAQKAKEEAVKKLWEMLKEWRLKSGDPNAISRAAKNFNAFWLNNVHNA